MTENKSGIERLSHEILQKLEDSIIYDKAGTTVSNQIKIITAALAAAEQRGREKGLEDAARRIEPTNPPNDWTQFAKDAAEWAEKIRAMKGERNENSRGMVD